MRRLRALMQRIESILCPPANPPVPIAGLEAYIAQAEAPAAPPPRTERLLELFEGRLLGPGVAYTPSPNTPGPSAYPPDTLLIHYTASLNAESAVRELTRAGKGGVSAHLVVDRDGTTFQLLSFDLIGWHAGVSEWQGKKGLNPRSIGIEMVNAGRLELRGGKYYTWSGQEVDESEVLAAVHRNEDVLTFWHLYTAKQVETVRAICHLLMQHYPIKHILGHEEVSPGRKIDPGPAFPLDNLRDDLGRPRLDAPA